MAESKNAEMLNRVFVSYSSKDREWVRVLVKNLWRLGVEYWWDRKLEPGDPWVREIFSRLEHSQALMVIISPHAVHSTRVRDEIEKFIAWNKDYKEKRRLIPVIKNPAKLPAVISDLHRYEDLTTSNEADYRRAVQKLAASLLHQSINKRWRFTTLDIPAEVRSDHAITCLSVQENIIRPIAKPARPAPGKLAAYLEFLESECSDTFRCYSGKQSKPLDEVFVELKTGELGTPGAMGEDHRTCDPLSKDANRRGHSLRAFVESSSPHCWWTLQGDPGSGKTTLLLHTALHYCRKAREELGRGFEPALLPVVIPLHAWQRSRVTWQAYVTKYYQAVEDAGSMLMEAAEAGRVLWLFDGLDEVDPGEAPAVAGKVGRLAKTYQTCRMVMSSRRFGYLRPDGFKELELLPLDPTAQQELLKNVTDPDKAEKIYDYIEAKRSLHELAENPFFLTHMALFAAWDAAGQLVPLPDKRAGLLRLIEDGLIDGKPGGASPLPEPDLCREVLETMALHLLLCGAGPYDNRLPTTILRNHQSALQLFRMWPEGVIDTRRFLVNLSRNGLLYSSGSSKKQWRFRHRAIQEHLAACCLAQSHHVKWEKLAQLLLPTSPAGSDTADLTQATTVSGAACPPIESSLLSIIDELTGRDTSQLTAHDANADPGISARQSLAIGASDLGRWSETFALLAGESDQPDALLRRLMEINPDLGLRALATADAVAPETIAEMLGLVAGGDEWEKRREVIERIPEQLGFSEEAALLLDQVREKTWHGADLFFIERAYLAIEEKAAQSAAVERARQCRDKIFAHLPKPPDDFLRTITIKGKTTGYWSDKCKGGKFLMGSPLTDDQRYQWEPEEFEVSLSPFKPAIIPVTNGLYELFDPDHAADRAFADEVKEAEQPFHPVVNVTWFEAVMFCRWATEILQRRLTPDGKQALAPGECVCLPSEAQWEYACRAGTHTRYWKGDKESDLAKVGWYEKNSGGHTHVVADANIPANDFGLYDVHGNVWEWCADEWSDPYSGKGIDPIVVDDPDNLLARRVYRGGSWGSDSRGCRSAYRNNFGNPGVRSWYQGFRLVLARRRAGLGY